jgi:hypothetical protein
MLAGSDLDFPFRVFGSAPHRLLISEDATPNTWQEENLAGWEIRRLSIEPRLRFVVADDHAIITELDESYSFKNLYFADENGVESTVEYFGKLWETGTLYDPCSSGPVLVGCAIFSRVTGKGDHRTEDQIQHFASTPQDLRNLDPNEFERFIAELLRRDGMSIQMTGRGRDGGRDILAWPSDLSLGSVLLVECKRYAASRKVDVRMVRALYGVLEAERANMGMIVTTSNFTQPAREFERSVKNRLVLRDFGDLAKWLRRLAERVAGRYP